VEDTDVVVLWGSNAREAHPIFFHHVLKGVRAGARLFVVDPRRTTTAQWADRWLGIDVGTDIALSNTLAREIIHAGLHHRDFIARATTGFEAYAASVEEWTLERGTAETGVPGDAIRELAHAYAAADRAQLCWTLGITEHHNAVDNVLALINLALLCGHVGRYGSGLNPLRGQNNVQGGGDMGAIPNRLAGFQDIHDPGVRARFDRAWDSQIPPEYGLHLSGMFEAMGRGDLTALYVIGENPAQSEADVSHAVAGSTTSAWCEAEGTVTSSERRVQRVRKAIDPPPGARDDIAILVDLAGRLGRTWEYATAETVWDEVRSVSPMHAGMSYARLEALGGIQWPCPSEDRLEPSFLHGRLWAEHAEARGAPAPFSVVEHDPPVDRLDDDFPLRLTTGRILDSYNTGVQSGGFRSPLRARGEAIALSPEDAAHYGVAVGARVRVVSRRGSVEAPVDVDPGLRPGLAFMAVHFPDLVDVNQLTIEAVDPKSGTSEFKATAVRLEPIG